MVNGENDFAYPFVINGKHVCTGMTLRDYFAAEAMKAMAWTADNMDGCAIGAYRIADAMIKARNYEA